MLIEQTLLFFIGKMLFIKQWLYFYFLILTILFFLKTFISAKRDITTRYYMYYTNSYKYNQIRHFKDMFDHLKV